MERHRPDRTQGYKTIAKAMVALSLGMVPALVAGVIQVSEASAAGKTHMPTVFLVIQVLCMMLGAGLGYHLMKTVRCSSRVLLIGAFCYLPVNCWSTWMRWSGAGYGYEGNEVIVTVIMQGLAWVTFSMQVVAVIHYMIKKAKAVSAGRIIGMLSIIWYLSFNFFGMVLGNPEVTRWKTGAFTVCCNVLSIILFFRMEREKRRNHHNELHFDSRENLSDFIKEQLPMAPIFCLKQLSGFTMMHVAAMDIDARMQTIAFTVILATSLGGAIFFGWGFDSMAQRTFQIMFGAGCCTVILMALTFYDTDLANYFAIWTAGFAQLTDTSAWVCYCSWVLINHKGKELLALSAMMFWFGSSGLMGLVYTLGAPYWAAIVLMCLCLIGVGHYVFTQKLHTGYGRIGHGSSPRDLQDGPEDEEEEEEEEEGSEEEEGDEEEEGEEGDEGEEEEGQQEEGDNQEPVEEQPDY